MPAWAWVVIALVVVAVVALAAWLAYRKRRTGQLRDTFGPEYDREVRVSDRRTAEGELQARREQRERLEIRPLRPAARERYSAAWRETQAKFVDDPAGAVTEADELVHRVMVERGYPMEQFEQLAADISVDHPQVVESYRAAHAVSLASQHGKATTEDLREAVVHYRSLFEELLADGEAPDRRVEEAR